MNQENLKLVGDFLRSKRESISPETVGLAKPRRTRTSGLRREDVAYFSGLSTIWYSKIERGQAAGISPQALISISKALRLTQLEYEYLCNLISPQALALEEPCSMVSEQTAQLLLQLNPLPALFMNDYLDIIKCNQSFNLMIGFDLDTLSKTEKNYLHLTMSHHSWQKFLCIDDDDKLKMHISRMAGFLRDTLAKRPTDERLKQKIETFRSLSHFFDQAWLDNTLQHPEEMSHTYQHTVLGKIILNKQLWWNFNGESRSRLNIYHPQNQAERQRLLDIIKDQ